MMKLIQSYLSVQTLAALIAFVCGDCVVPEHSDGTWQLSTGLRKYSGDPIVSGETLVWSCDEGFYLLGEDESTAYQMQCINQSWNKEDPPFCEPKSCILPILANGLYSIHATGDILSSGEYTYYECTTGHTHDHDMHPIQCTMGKLTPSDPLCIPEGMCKNPKIKDGDVKKGGRVFTDNFARNGTVLQVECRQGFKLEGPSPIYCGDDQWGILPTCTPASCQIDTFLIENAELILDNGQATGGVVKHDTEVTFKCTNGYTPIADSPLTATCKYGTWTSLGDCLSGEDNHQVDPEQSQVPDPEKLNDPEENHKNNETSMVVTIAVVAVVAVCAVAITTVVIIYCKRAHPRHDQAIPISTHLESLNQNDMNQATAIDADKDDGGSIYEEIPDVIEDTGYMAPANRGHGYQVPGRPLPEAPYLQLVGSNPISTGNSYKKLNPAPLPPPIHPSLVCMPSVDNGIQSNKEEDTEPQYFDMNGPQARFDASNRSASMNSLDNPTYVL